MQREEARAVRRAFRVVGVRLACRARPRYAFLHTYMYRRLTMFVCAIASPSVPPRIEPSNNGASAPLSGMKRASKNRAADVRDEGFQEQQPPPRFLLPHLASTRRLETRRISLTPGSRRAACSFIERCGGLAGVPMLPAHHRFSSRRAPSTKGVRLLA